MPLVNELFHDAVKLANTTLLMYTNGDIIFTNELMKTLRKAKGQFKEFMLIGQRFDISIPHELNFHSSKWDQPLRERFNSEKERWFGNNNDNRWALDYFVFTKDFWKDIEIPPFLLGVQVFDNWLVHQPNTMGKTVIDGTKTVHAFHQSHEWTHGSDLQKKRKEYNTKLAGKWHFGNTDRASHYTTWCEEKDSTKLERACIHKRTFQ